MSEVPTVVRICCADYRQPKDGAHLFTWSNAGPSVDHSMVENFATIVECISSRLVAIELVSHTDCAMSKIRCGFPLGAALTEEEGRRVEDCSIERLKENACRLLSNDVVRKALKSGVKFRLGHYDVDHEEISWLEDLSAEFTAKSKQGCC